jgi:hypothetical protein
LDTLLTRAHDSVYGRLRLVALLIVIRVRPPASRVVTATNGQTRPSVTSDKTRVRHIRVNGMLTSDRVKPELLCPRWLPRWILGHYVIGAGARTAWWGRAQLPEGRAQPPECKNISKKKK